MAFKGTYYTYDTSVHLGQDMQTMTATHENM
jgi:hypothetical protein